MNKSIRLLVEGFFDDEIFDVEDNIKTDIEDLAKYYDYRIGDIYYLNDKPYAVCCGESKYFKNNKPRFCLYEEKTYIFKWIVKNKFVEDLECFESEFEYFYLLSFKDFKHIDEDGYKNTQIIKNNYNISEFPVFEYCIKFGDKIYLPAIDELLQMYLNKNKLGKYGLSNYFYWSSTLKSAAKAYIINTNYSYVSNDFKSMNKYVHPFFHID